MTKFLSFSFIVSLFICSYALAQDNLAAPKTAAEMDSSVEPPPPEITDLDSEKPAPPKKKARPAPVAQAPETVESSDDITSEEARFARIYQKYNSQELGDEKWTAIAGDKVSESYGLQSGDNLWDISIKLFGNGFYWPKVWQLNDDITNPHLVEPGKTLRFTPGSSTAPPSLGVDVTINQNIVDATTVNESSPAEEPEFDTIVTQESPEGSQIVIPPGRPSRPVLLHIPPSFKEAAKTIGDYDRKTGFARDGLLRPEPKIKASSVPSIVVETPWEADGKVVEMEGESTTAATYQRVIIHLSGPAQRGDTFTIFNTNGKVTDPTTDYTIGVELETRAEVEVLEALEGAMNNTYRGIITYAILPVRMGDRLKAGKLITRVNFEATGAMSSVAARVVNGESNKRLLFALHAIVFLDKGEEDGLQKGSLLPVLKNLESRNPAAVIAFDSKPIGLLKIVEAEKHVSTAVIVSESDDIRPGDMTQLTAPELSDNPNSVDKLDSDDQTMEKDMN